MAIRFRIAAAGRMREHTAVLLPDMAHRATLTQIAIIAIENELRLSCTLLRFRRCFRQNWRILGEALAKYT